MLIDFSIENYLSIKNRLNFSLVESDDEEGSKIKIHRAILTYYLQSPYTDSMPQVNQTF